MNIVLDNAVDEKAKTDIGMVVCSCYLVLPVLQNIFHECLTQGQMSCTCQQTLCHGSYVSTDLKGLYFEENPSRVEHSSAADQDSLVKAVFEIEPLLAYSLWELITVIYRL